MTTLLIFATLLVTYGLGWSGGSRAQWRLDRRVINRQHHQLVAWQAEAARCEAVVDQVLAECGNPDADMRLWEREAGHGAEVALIGGAGVWLLMARRVVLAETRRVYAAHLRAVTSVPDADRALAYDLIRRGQR